MEILLLIIFIQIFIESFPVSSSGHVELVEKIMRGASSLSALPDFFDHFLHGPTILILIILFRKDWFYPFKKLLGGLFDDKNLKKDSYQNLLKIFLKLCGYLFVTTSIAVVGWLFVKTKFQEMSWFTNDITLLIGFSVTMILLFLLLIKNKNFKESETSITSINVNQLNLKKVLIIGFVQALALLPGISRFAIVYATSRLLNISARRAFQFTFLIQFPLIVPAFFLGFIKLIKSPDLEKYFNLPVFFTILVSTILAYVGLFLMQKLSQKNKVGLFAFYMFIPIGVLLWFVFC